MPRLVLVGTFALPSGLVTQLQLQLYSGVPIGVSAGSKFISNIFPSEGARLGVRSAWSGPRSCRRG